MRYLKNSNLILRHGTQNEQPKSLPIKIQKPNKIEKKSGSNKLNSVITDKAFSYREKIEKYFNSMKETENISFLLNIPNFENKCRVPFPNNIHNKSNVKINNEKVKIKEPNMLNNSITSMESNVSCAPSKFKQFDHLSQLTQKTMPRKITTPREKYNCRSVLKNSQTITKYNNSKKTKCNIKHIQKYYNSKHLIKKISDNNGKSLNNFVGTLKNSEEHNLISRETLSSNEKFHSLDGLVNFLKIKNHSGQEQDISFSNHKTKIPVNIFERPHKTSRVRTQEQQINNQNYISSNNLINKNNLYNNRKQCLKHSNKEPQNQETNVHVTKHKLSLSLNSLNFKEKTSSNASLISANEKNVSRLEKPSDKAKLFGSIPEFVNYLKTDLKSVNTDMLKNDRIQPKFSVFHNTHKKLKKQSGNTNTKNDTICKHPLSQISENALSLSLPSNDYLQNNLENQNPLITSSQVTQLSQGFKSIFPEEENVIKNNKTRCSFINDNKIRPNSNSKMRIKSSNFIENNRWHNSWEIENDNFNKNCFSKMEILQRQFKTNNIDHDPPYSLKENENISLHALPKFDYNSGNTKSFQKHHNSVQFNEYGINYNTVVNSDSGKSPLKSMESNTIKKDIYTDIKNTNLDTLSLLKHDRINHLEPLKRKSFLKCSKLFNEQPNAANNILIERSQADNNIKEKISQNNFISSKPTKILTHNKSFDVIESVNTSPSLTFNDNTRSDKIVYPKNSFSLNTNSKSNQNSQNFSQNLKESKTTFETPSDIASFTLDSKIDKYKPVITSKNNISRSDLSLDTFSGTCNIREEIQNGSSSSNKRILNERYFNEMKRKEEHYVNAHSLLLPTSCTYPSKIEDSTKLSPKKLNDIVDINLDSFSETCSINKESQNMLSYSQHIFPNEADDRYSNKMIGQKENILFKAPSINLPTSFTYSSSIENSTKLAPKKSVEIVDLTSESFSEKCSIIDRASQNVLTNPEHIFPYKPNDNYFNEIAINKENNFKIEDSRKSSETFEYIDLTSPLFETRSMNKASQHVSLNSQHDTNFEEISKNQENDLFNSLNYKKSSSSNSTIPIVNHKINESFNMESNKIKTNYALSNNNILSEDNEMDLEELDQIIDRQCLKLDTNINEISSQSTIFSLENHDFSCKSLNRSDNTLDNLFDQDRHSQLLLENVISNVHELSQKSDYHIQKEKRNNKLNKLLHKTLKSLQDVNKKYSLSNSQKTKILKHSDINHKFVLKKYPMQNIYIREDLITDDFELLNNFSANLSNKLSIIRDYSAADKKLLEGLNKICNNSKYLCTVEDRHSISNTKTKDVVLQRIDQILQNVVDDFSLKKSPVLIYKQQTFKNCRFKDGRLELKSNGEAILTKLSYKNYSTQSTFCLIVYLLEKIRELIISNQKLTKREIYYQIKEFVCSQTKVNFAVNKVSCILDVPPWQLNILSQKGLVYGDLKISFSSNKVLNCNIPGTLIPAELDDIIKIETSASFILIVEKESIFHKLREEDLPNKLAKPFLMLTGKGFPDLNTQYFAKKLWMALCLPVFIFVDADPHGINIMINYKFGSLNNAHISNYLAIPKAKWLGVLPSEIDVMGITKQKLSDTEIRLIRSLLKMPYINEEPKIADELQVLLKLNAKGGCEGLIKNDNFLSNFYFPLKFYNNDFI